MAKGRRKRGRRSDVVRAQEPQSAASHRGTVLVIGVVLALATVASYWKVMSHGFIDLDDPKYISENRMVQKGLTSESVAWAFTTQHASNWHPLTWLSHMLDCELFGLEPRWHHLTNLLLHVASALLLLAIMRRLTGKTWASAVVAGLFALHPIHVESVAWLAERKDVLSTLFWMLTLWTYLRYVDRPGRWRYLALALIYALGLLAKPMLVTLPFVLLLLDYWPLGRIEAGQTVPAEHLGGEPGTCRVLPYKRRRLMRSAAGLLLEKAPLMALALASSVLTLRAQRGGGAVGSLQIFSLGERVANALVAYVAYIWKTIWPRDLSVFYPYPSTPPTWQAGVAAVLLLGVTLLVLRARRRHAYLAVGWFWYLGTLLPVIGLVQVGGQAMADRYTYVPTIGLFLMAALGVPELLSGQRRAATVMAGAAGLVLVALAVRTWFQVGYWKDSFTLFERSLSVTNNNYKMHNSLAGLHIDVGDLPAARRHLEQALRFLPDYPDAHVNLGLVELRSGAPQAAIEQYREALRLDPGHAQAHDNLGNALAQSGRHQEAITHFRRALSIEADRARTHNNLANALAQTGRIEEAVQHFEQAIELEPAYANAHANLGDLLVRVGRHDEALPHLETALALEPGHLLAHFNLGRALAMRQDLESAKRHFEAAINIEPRLPEPHFYLGLAHLYSGDLQRALEQYRILTEIEPGMADHLLREIQAEP